MSTSSAPSNAVMVPVSNAAAAHTRLKALPQSAQKKYEHLRRMELRARALIDGLLDQQHRVRDQRDNALRELGMFERANHYTLIEATEDQKTRKRASAPAEPAERAALAARVEALKAEMARIRDEQSAANPGFSTGGILDFLTRQPATRTFTAARVPFPSLGNGETFAQALVRNRVDQASLLREVNSVENAGETVAEAKARMRVQVQAIADRGRPDVGALFSGRDIDWATDTFAAGGHGHHEHVVAATVKDAFALGIWANRDEIVRKLDRQIEAAGDDAVALDAGLKAQRLAELQARLLLLQRKEEAIVERLEGDGQFIRRTCTDPLVLLGIE